MKVKLLHDTIVRFEAGAVLDVSEAEAARLKAFGNAEEVQAEKKTEPAKPTKKTGKK